MSDGDKPAPSPAEERSTSHRRPIFVTGVLFLAAVPIILGHIRGLQTELVRAQALQNAALLSGAIAEFRTVYTSEVVERLRSTGVEVTHDYLLREGAVPLPATLTMILGDRIGALESGGVTRLYSPYPFPWRVEGGGLADSFAVEAWEVLSRDAVEPFYRFETLDGSEVLRYATADLMRPECVECHNGHPDSPKSDWTVGELRGVLEVITPLDVPLQVTRSGLVDTVVLMLLLAAGGLILLGLTMRRS